MAQESSYKSAYFDNFKDFADKHTVPLRESEPLNFNFNSAVYLDNNDEVNNNKAKYAVQGSNPIRMLRKLIKELKGANDELFAKINYNMSRYYTDTIESVHLQETLLLETKIWQLVTEWTTADYIYFQSKNEPKVEEDERTPLTLLSEIVKEDHELLSCYFLIKWLENIYQLELRVPSSLKQIEDDKEDFINFLNKLDLNVNNEVSKFLFQWIRSGKLRWVWLNFEINLTLLCLELIKLNLISQR